MLRSNVRSKYLYFVGRVLNENNTNNNGYFYVLFVQRAHSPFIYKNGMNIALGKPTG